jgi:hypothetical protein
MDSTIHLKACHRKAWMQDSAPGVSNDSDEQVNP